MRIRSIKPEFFKHDVLGSMSPYARLLFIGLWCMADCAGRLEDRPKRIKVEVLPYDEQDIEGILNDLQTAKLISRYEVNGEHFIEIPSFLRHQRISGKESEAESRFPAASQKAMVKRRGSNGEAMGKQPESLVGKGNGRETETVTRFALFWAAYPKKKAKDSAERAFAKVEVSIETLLASIERFKQDPSWQKDKGQFIPYPATWLNQHRWEDEADIPVAPPKREIAPYVNNTSGI
jgi:hypothetical protein